MDEEEKKERKLPAIHKLIKETLEIKDPQVKGIFLNIIIDGMERIRKVRMMEDVNLNE